jgi:DNA-binding transcriptional LysR family regulator
LELRLLRYFLAVAESGTLTAASEQLGLAQPAVSQAIAKLEAEVGTRLFQRTRRGAELTAAGVAFREEVLDGLGMLDAAVMRARERAMGKIGKLTLGVVSSALDVAVPTAIRLMRLHFPKVQPVLLEMKNDEQSEALRTSVIDLAIFHTPIALASWLNERVISQADLVVAVPESFPIPSNGRLPFESLCAQDFIVFREPRNSGLRVGLQAACRAAGFKMRIAHEVPTMMSALSLVACECGVAVVPRTTTVLARAGVRYVEIDGGAGLPRATLSVAWRPTSKETVPGQLVKLLAAELGAPAMIESRSLRPHELK